MKKIILTTLTLFFCVFLYAEENDAIYVWVDGESICYKLESMPKVSYDNGSAILTLSGKSTPELTIPLSDDSNLRITYGIYKESATSIEDVTANSKVVQIEKYITGGNLVIVKDGKKYNSKGIELK